MAFSGVEKKILVVTIIVFVAGVVLMAVVLSKTSTADKRIVGSCPDFWYNANYVPCHLSEFGCCADNVTAKTDISGSYCGKLCSEYPNGCCDDNTTPKNADGSNCSAATSNCYNINKLGNYANTTYSCKEAQFDVAPYIGASGECEKQKWAANCNVSWDGITNVPEVCSQPAAV
jgi:hypothetical protein